MKTIVAAGYLLAGLFAAHGADFKLGKRGTLSITVPENWSAEEHVVNRPDGKPLGYTFDFKPRGNANAKCLLTFACVTNGAPNKEVIDTEVLRICEEFVDGSIEKKKNLRQFTLKEGYGSYCVFTDASLVGKQSKPDDFKVLGAGQVQPGKDLIGVVSFYADETNSEEFKAMIKMINSLKWKAGDAGVSDAVSKEQTISIREDKSDFMLTVPISKLTMTIPKAGLSNAKSRTGGSTDSPRYFLFEGKKEGINISGWFESDKSFTSAEKVWEDDTREWARGGLPTPTNVVFQKVGRWETVIYDYLPMSSVSNTHIRAQWVEAGTWIDLHISLTSDMPLAECRKRLMALLKRIKVGEKM